MTLDDIYARDLRRHRLIGRLLSMGGVAAEFVVLTAAGGTALAWVCNLLRAIVCARAT